MLLLITMTILLSSCGKYTTYEMYKSYEIDGVKYETMAKVKVIEGEL